MKEKILTIALILLFLLTIVYTAKGYSNGGYSDDVSQPDYGTHDWIAQHALEWLPEEEKQYILDHLTLYLYATELPDNNRAEDKIGDTTKHHVYFRNDGTLQDNSSAVRAYEEFQKALDFLKANDFENAAKTAGIMTHYIADMAVFGHVMSESTSWGGETHHSDYENYINTRTSSFESEFTAYLQFDGNLSLTSPYDASTALAYNTTFGIDSNYGCTWMDTNYNWSNPQFSNRAGESLNLAANAVADVLHTLYLSKAYTIPEFPITSIAIIMAATTAILSGLILSKRKDKHQ